MNKYRVEVNKQGTKYWLLNGMRHREDGPAVEATNGAKYWYRNDMRSHEDGTPFRYRRINKDGSPFRNCRGLRHRGGHL